MHMTDLENLRRNIDDIDDQIVVLLFKRFEITREVGLLKANNHLPAHDHSREDQILSRLEEKSRLLSLDPDLIRSVYSLILSEVLQINKAL